MFKFPPLLQPEPLYSSVLFTPAPAPGFPPENKAADIAEQAVQESFEEQVDRIRTATTGDSPADDLADLGNARKR